MIVLKITTGFVVQRFDTETKKFTSQSFVASDECVYEDETGNPVESDLLIVDGEEAYLPFEMEHPHEDSLS